MAAPGSRVFNEVPAMLASSILVAYGTPHAFAIKVLEGNVK
jgi:hypothetical protein